MYNNIRDNNVEGSTNISSTKINNICRACLKQKGSVNLFEFGNEDNDLLFSDLFTLFSLFQAEQEDGFPQRICQDCANFVSVFYSFKQMIKENQIILQLVSEIKNLDNSESFKSDFVSRKINQSNIDSPNSDLIFDIFNRKVHIQITNDNKYIWLDTKSEQVDDDNRSLQLENIEINNDNYMRLENVDEEHKTLSLDHAYAKICNEELVCPLCFMKFSNKDEFISHRIKEFKQSERNGNIEELTCIYCNLKFNSRNDYLAHMKLKSEKTENRNPILTSNEYNCPKCKLKFNSRLKFLKHRREERDGVTGSPNISRRQYICSVCNIKFNSRVQYILHRKKEAAKKSEKESKIITRKEFTCLYCSLKFYSKHEYLKHRKEEAKKTSQCAYCKKVIHTSQLDNHLRLIHKKLPPLKCDICKKQFVSSTFYKNHMLAHRDGFFCEICGRKCFTARALQAHKKSHDTEKTVHKCETCGKTFKYSYLLREHINTHTGEKPFLCSSCGATFSSQVMLHQHTLCVHTERPFKCQLCENDYASEKKLYQHVQRHENKKDNVCHICGSKFLKKSCLSLHLKYHDRNGNTPRRITKRLQCLSCKKEYIEIAHFKVHIMSHLGESPYLCLFCGKQSYDENEYNIHSKEHDKKIHKCDICSKMFESNAKLTNHTRSHTGEKPFQCNQCGNSYQLKNHLKRHLFLHTGLKPFSCKYCEKTFALKENCMQHEKIHQGIGDYICSLCGKGFYTGSRLRKHQKIHMKEH